MANTTTHNGDSKDKISLEEAAKLIDAMKRNGENPECVVQAVGPEQVKGEANANVIALIVKGKGERQGEKEGDSLEPKSAAEVRPGKGSNVIKVEEEPKQPNTMENGNDR